MTGRIENRLRSASPDLDKIRQDLALLRNASEKAVSSRIAGIEARFAVTALIALIAVTAVRQVLIALSEHPKQ